mmetsp:Transcript_33476/g.58651  ORF Transcript_33476/g.58651 Transcript_33476/m.58651 type:complete len:110 (+) Transcript_33476:864-1193(+)
MKLITAIEGDVKMLAWHGIMDYSLFGAHFKGSEMPQDSRYCFRQKGQSDCFFTLGIIDILQEYNASKKCEHCLKRTFKRVSLQDLSSVNPQVYAERFLRFCRKIIEPNV